MSFIGKTRPYQLAVLGVTGLTGKIIAEYLARNAPKTLKWAIAGRNIARLEEVKKNIVTIRPDFKNIGVFVCDVTSKSSVDNVVSQANVTISAVGPYDKFGTLVVDACVRFNTDYVDITGELPWVKEMIEAYHQKAAANGTIIIPMCGFESTPADIGTFAVVQYIRTNFNRPTAYVKGSLGDVSGGVSGGTVASLDQAFAKPWEMLRSFINRNYLIPASKLSVGLPLFPIWYDFDLRSWQGFFVPSEANVRVVYRSNALLQNYYGPNFYYTESKKFSNVIFAAVVTFAVTVFFTLMAIPLFRKFFMYFAPKPGEGPSREKIRQGNYSYHFYGEAAKTVAATDRVRVEAVIHGKSCPGYGETPLMACEAALALVLQREKIPGRGGVMTTASALGDVLLNRLRSAGVIINVNRRF